MTMATMPTAAAITPNGAPPHGPSVWQRGLYTQVGCLVLALGLTVVNGHFLANWLYSVLIGTLCWLFIDAARALVVRLRAPGGDDRWPGWAWMLPITMIGGLGGFYLGATLGNLIMGDRVTVPGLQPHAADGASTGVLVMSLAATVVITGFYHVRGRIAATEAAAADMRRQATEAQLTLLQSQLEPHMLFNTLANLRVLIALDAPRAQAMLDHLIAYLRSTLAASRAMHHPLSVEFDRLADYLSLMGVRMGPRLVTAFDLPEALRDMPVPPLVLQPLVENAIRHGLEPQVAGGRIEVSARAAGGRLVLSVRDTGAGLSTGVTAASPAGGGAGSDAGSTGTPGSGFGLHQVRERLATRYGAAASLTLRPAADLEGGTLAEVVLPLQPPQVAP